MIADGLRRQADVFTDLLELKSKIGRDSERPASREPRHRAPRLLQRPAAAAPTEGRRRLRRLICQSLNDSSRREAVVRFDLQLNSPVRAHLVRAQLTSYQSVQHGRLSRLAHDVAVLFSDCQASAQAGRAALHYTRMCVDGISRGPRRN